MLKTKTHFLPAWITVFCLCRWTTLLTGVILKSQWQNKSRWGELRLCWRVEWLHQQHKGIWRCSLCNTLQYTSNLNDDVKLALLSLQQLTGSRLTPIHQYFMMSLLHTELVCIPVLWSAFSATHYDLYSAAVCPERSDNCKGCRNNIVSCR